MDLSTQEEEQGMNSQPVNMRGGKRDSKAARPRKRSRVLNISTSFAIPACFQILLLVLVSFVCVHASVDPTSFACSTHNSTVIGLSWSMATDASTSGYYLYIRRTDGLKTQEGPGITLPARNYISYTFYGLGFFAQYDISINSYSNLGTNNTVYTVSCTTQAENPDLSNFNLTCEGISYTEINCSWGDLDAVYWNGVPYGWQLGYISYYNDVYTYVNFNSTSTLGYTITGLQFDTKYLINIRSVNSGGFMGPYSSTNSKTLGWPKNTENETRYYCYEAVPGYLEFSWHEMPCTIYSGTIAGLLLTSLLLLMLCCCMCCCKGGGKDNSKTEINIFNEENNEYYGDDGGDDDDDYDDESEEVAESEEDDYEDDDDDDGVSDGNESPDKATAIVKKKKLPDSETEEEQESDEEEDEVEEDDDNGDSEEEETDAEIYAGLTEDEKKAKKEERATEKKKKKEEKAKKREEAKKRKEEARKKKEEERKEKIKERMKKRNAVMTGAATVKTVDETKKDKQVKKKPVDSDDEESEGYYEDWNPDADENPDVVVNKISNKDTGSPDGDKKKKAKDKNKNKDKEKAKATKERNKKDGKTVSRAETEGASEYEEDSDEYYDSDDEDEYESSEDENMKKDLKIIKGKDKKNPRVDSGRGSASSNTSTDQKNAKTKDQKKNGGFLSNLFGTSKAKENKSNTNKNSKQNQQNKQSEKKVDYGDWDDDEPVFEQTKSSKAGTIGGHNNTVSNTNTTTNGYPMNNNNGIFVNAPINVMNGTGNKISGSGHANFHERPPQGYGQNSNGTFYPLPGNFNESVPQGYQRNTDGSIQKTTHHQPHYTNADNNPPPGYAKNFDGSFYPVRGNKNPVIPPGYIKNPDGTIYKNPNHSGPGINAGYNNDSNPPGYGKNPDGTFYPLPGIANPTLPSGFARNHDGSIYRTSNQGPYAHYQPNAYQNSMYSKDPPPGYNKNPDGTFCPKPGIRNPVVPPGFARNPDGSIYRSGGTNNQNNTSSVFANNQDNHVPQGYTQNSDGTYRPLPGNNNSTIPQGFAKDNRGNIYRTSVPMPSSISDVSPPAGYAKNPDGSFRPLPTNRNPTVPTGFVKNPDGSVFHDPFQTSTNPIGPPSGYGTNADGTYFPLPSNRNPVVPLGYVKNPNGSISKHPGPVNSLTGNNAPPQGYGPTTEGTFRPLPGNKNPVVPVGFTRNHDGSIQRNNKPLNIEPNNTEIPPGYARNPDGTFRPLPKNRNPIVPAGFTKNPDGTIRRNRTNGTSNSNAIPPGYGKNPDGTYFPLKSNPNPVVPEGFRKNPDGTISKLPQYQNRPGIGSKYPSTQGTVNQPGYDTRKHNNYQTNPEPYPYGPADLDPPEISDERDKFKDLFNAKAKRKAAQKRTVADRDGKDAYKYLDVPANFTGDGDDIFATNQNASFGPVGTTNTKLPIKPTRQNVFTNSSQNPYAQQPSLGSNVNPVGELTDNQPTNTGIQGMGANGNQQPTGRRNHQNVPGNYGQQNAYHNKHSEVVSNTNDPNHYANDNQQNDPNRNGRLPFSFGNGNQEETVQNNRKPLSFRDNDPRYDEYKQRQPRDTRKHPGRTRDAPGHQDDPRGHGDASDTEILPDEGPPNKRKPIARFRTGNQTPAWGTKSPNIDKLDKSGKQTPVTELKRQDRQELIEPEPVLGSDRLGNKFPFLNIDKKREQMATNKAGKNGDSNPDNRRKSESDLVLRGRELVDKKDLPKREFPPAPNTLTGEAGEIARSDDLGGLKPETRDQIFYGFGVGRWRVMAAKWMNKWKMKKKPVKTAKASWD